MNYVDVSGVEYLFECFNELAYIERLACHLIVLVNVHALNVHSEVSGKLSAVELCNDNLLVCTEHFGRVCRQRVEIGEMCERHFLAFGCQCIESRVQMSVSTAETYNQKVSIFCFAFDFEVGNGDARYFSCPKVGHELVVFRFAA